MPRDYEFRAHRSFSEFHDGDNGGNSGNGGASDDESNGSRGGDVNMFTGAEMIGEDAGSRRNCDTGRLTLSFGLHFRCYLSVRG